MGREDEKGGERGLEKKEDRSVGVSGGRHRGSQVCSHIGRAIVQDHSLPSHIRSS